MGPSAPASNWGAYAGLAVASVAVLTVILVALTGGGGGLHHFNDFHTEAWPAYQALLKGHLILFVQRAPAYVGSLILRAPFAFIPSIWGGGWRAVYVATAFPCLVAAPVLLSWLLYQRRNATPTPSTVGVMLVGTFNPPLLIAIFGGHPEDALGAVLCVAAVIAAVRNRPGWCTAFLTIAIINKSWALVAFPVAVAVLPTHRLRTAALVTLLVGAVLGPAIEIQHSASGAGLGAVAGTGIGTIFNPASLVWWFGRGSWLASHARFFIVGGAFVLGAIWWMRWGRPGPKGPRVEQALLLLALVLLLRAALDPWDNVYYHLPFLLALLAYEAHTRRWPIASTVYAILVIFIAPDQGLGTLGLIIPVHALIHPNGDLQAAAYAVVMVPTLLWLAGAVFLRGDPAKSLWTPARRGRAGSESAWPADSSRSTPERP
jgi:hypothetical protein